MYYHHGCAPGLCVPLLRESARQRITKCDFLIIITANKQRTWARLYKLILGIILIRYKQYLGTLRLAHSFNLLEFSRDASWIFYLHEKGAYIFIYMYIYIFIYSEREREYLYALFRLCLSWFIQYSCIHLKIAITNNKLYGSKL